MASRKDVVKLTDDDFKEKSFSGPPAGKHLFTVNKKSTIKPGQNGNVLNLMLTVKAGQHKGKSVFDNIAASTGWKIAQLLKAFGIDAKKAKKLKLDSLQAILKYVLGKDIAALIRVQKSEEWGKQSKIVTLLPVSSIKDKDEEDDEDDEEEEDDDADESVDDDEEDEDEDDDSDEEDDEDEDEEDEDDDDDEEDEDEDEDDEEDEDEDEDDEEEEEEPVRTRRSAKKAAAKKTTAKKSAAKKTTAKKTGKKK